MSYFSGSVSAASTAAPVPAPGAEALSLDNRSRPLADFPPDIWGDHFLAYSSHSLANENDQLLNHENLKEEVRKMITAGIEDSSRNLDLVDSIQRLGIAYLFHKEIEDLLEKVLAGFDEYVEDNNDDLYKISLCFRLLRQQGYRVSCGMFSTFKDEDGKFKESLKECTEGLLSLYEATQLRVHGEDILEEAHSFCVTQLGLLLKDLSPCPLSTQINHTLKYPIRKNLPRLEAKFYISTYQYMPSHNQSILKLAMLDFNILQRQHQRELCQLSKWWKELDAKRKFPFARQRIVECYFWILGIYFEPEFALGRQITTKAIALTSVLDDIYDAYGTHEELQVLTEAIERWDSDVATHLPDSIRTYYMTLLDTYNKIGSDIANHQGTSDGIHYLIQEKKKLAKAYNSQVKWSHEKYIPTMEEYMQVALTSSGYPFLSCASLIGMGDIATRDSYQWVVSSPKLILGSALIARLLDDITSHEFEQQREHSASSVECYMKQHGVTRQEAVDELWEQVSDAWKDFNEECMRPSAIPRPLLMPLINFTCAAHAFYQIKDGYTNPTASKDSVASLLVHPIP